MISLTPIESSWGSNINVFDTKPDRAVKIESAEIGLNKGINLNPDGIELYRQRGEYYFENRRFQEAISDFNYVINNDSKSLNIIYLRALSNQQIGNNEEALADYLSIIQAKPTYNAALYFNLGLIFSNLGQLESSIESYTAAIKLNPKYEEAYCNMGSIYLDLRKYDEAIKNYSQALTIDPEESCGLKNRGIAYLRKNRFAEGINDLRKSLALEPNNPTTLNELAWVLATCPTQELRNGAEAIKHIEQQAKSSKDGSELDTLAAAYAEIGDFNSAISTQNEVIKIKKQQSGSSHSLSPYQERLSLYMNKKPYRQKTEE